MERKWVHLMFAVGGVILAWLFAKTGDWVWGYFAKPNDVLLGVGSTAVAGVIAYIAWTNEQLFGLATEVVSELSKVTWPTRHETLYSSIVVIITSIVSAAFLGMCDGIWSWVTRVIYG